jgi:hypothetical protein
VIAGAPPSAAVGAWALRGVVSNERYVTRAEKTALVALQDDRPPARGARRAHPDQEVGRMVGHDPR